MAARPKDQRERALLRKGPHCKVVDRRGTRQQGAGRILAQMMSKGRSRNCPNLRCEAVAKCSFQMVQEEVDLASTPRKAVSEFDNAPLRPSALQGLKKQSDAIDFQRAAHPVAGLFTSSNLSDRISAGPWPLEITDLLRKLDIWSGAIVKAPASQLRQSDLTAEKIQWLPRCEDRFTLRADPFGIWEEEELHVFVERCDYRVLKGVIELLRFDRNLNFLGSRVVLERPWHLSYPIVFRSEREIYMLPEAARSGKLLLYRATSFPFDWEPAELIGVPGRAVDSTPFVHSGRWWLLYTLVTRTRGLRNYALNLAFGDRPTGPFQAHPLNPVRVGLDGARPAGTPIVQEDGIIHVPVQDSSQTYGGAIRRLTILHLDDKHFEAEDESWLSPAPALQPFDRGLHTLSAAGDISLVDCKFVDRSVAGTLAWRRGKLAQRNRERRGMEIPGLRENE